MKKLKAAIVGCGRISVSYADAFHRLSDEVELAYAVDKDPALAKAFAEEFNCSWTTDFDEILDKDIDVVHLCLPHFLHPVMAIKAMKAGINVLTEKPIATCLQDADRMIRTAEETHVKLGVIFQTRYTKSVEKLREMIQRGDFGKILTARSYLTWNRPLDYYSGSDWKGTWDKEGGGVLIDQAIHSIDRVRYMLDSDVEWIDGSVHNYVHHFVKVEDAADAAIMFKNGCLYNLYACNIYGADSPINIELIGEKDAWVLSRTWAITSWTAPMPRSETLMRPQMWALITGEAAITCRSVTSTVLSVRIFLLPSTDWKAENP